MPRFGGSPGFDPGRLEWEIKAWLKERDDPQYVEEDILRPKLRGRSRKVALLVAVVGLVLFTASPWIIALLFGD